MRIFSQNPLALLSEFKGTRLLNFAGEPAAKSGSQPGEADEPDPSTPAGKKWAALREEVKTEREKTRLANEARLKAEGRAEAIEDFKKQFGTPPAKVEEVTEPEINPKDEIYVGAILKKQMQQLGLDKIPEALSAMQRSTSEVQATTILDKAKANLEKEFAGTVPFSYDEAMAYAKEKGYGMIASTAEEALRMAHKQMNDEKFIAFYRGETTGKKGRSAPRLVKSGTAPSPDVLEETDDSEAIVPTTFADARAAAHKMFEAEDAE